MHYFFLAIAVIFLLIFLLPVSLGYDSTQKQVKVRWLGLTVTRELKEKHLQKLTRKAPKTGAKSRGWALLRRLWQEKALGEELVIKVSRLGLDLLRIISFQDSEVSFSLREPMWNGILYGVLVNTNIEGLALSANFERQNFAKIWLTFYPFQVTVLFLSWLVRLPLQRLIRLAWDIRKIK